MSCMISFANPELYVHREKDNCITYGGEVKRYNIVGQLEMKIVLLLIGRTCRTLHTLNRIS